MGIFSIQSGDILTIYIYFIPLSYFGYYLILRGQIYTSFITGCSRWYKIKVESDGIRFRRRSNFYENDKNHEISIYV